MNYIIFITLFIFIPLISCEVKQESKTNETIIQTNYLKKIEDHYIDEKYNLEPNFFVKRNNDLISQQF